MNLVTIFRYEELQLLWDFKEFLRENTTLSFLTLSVIFNLYLFKRFIAEKDSKFGLVVGWLPVINDMQQLLRHAANKARTNKPKDS